MSETSETVRTEAAKQAVIFAFFILTGLAYLWMTSPDALRTLKMRAAHSIRQASSRCAARLGWMAMDAELATGRRNYAASYYVSRLRDAASGYYERARGAR